MIDPSNTPEQNYRIIVEARRVCTKACDGLINLSDARICQIADPGVREHPGLWSLWQGNLHANVMIVGQDWGDVKYLEKENKRRTKRTGCDGSDNVTNKNIMELVKVFDARPIEPPEKLPRVLPEDTKFFFTNAVLCIRKGRTDDDDVKAEHRKRKKSGMSGDADPQWFDNCAKLLAWQIQTIKPKVIVAIGEEAFKAVINAGRADPGYKVNYLGSTISAYSGVVRKEGELYIDVVKRGPAALTNSTWKLDAKVFPTFHCGHFGVVNRRHEEYCCTRVRENYEKASEEFASKSKEEKTEALGKGWLDLHRDDWARAADALNGNAHGSSIDAMG